MREKLLIFPRIEKTGGTSLTSMMADQFGKNRVLIGGTFDQRYSRLSDSRISGIGPKIDAIKKVLARYPALFSMAARFRHKLGDVIGGSTGLTLEEIDLGQIDVICGHFPADRFDEVFPDAETVTIIRDPLKRAISHFLHIKRNKSARVFRDGIDFAPNITFRDFALSDCMQNFQTQTLGTKRPEDINYLGTTENLGALAVSLGLASDEKDVACFNTSHMKPTMGDMGIDGAFECEFRKKHREDYDLHQYAKERG